MIKTHLSLAPFLVKGKKKKTIAKKLRVQRGEYIHINSNLGSNKTKQNKIKFSIIHLMMNLPYTQNFMNINFTPQMTKVYQKQILTTGDIPL